MDWSENELFTKGKIRALSGRVRHMPEALQILGKYGKKILDPYYIKSKFSHSKEAMDSAKAARSKLKNCLNNAKNFQIQSLSASIVNRAAIAINRYLKSNNIDGLVIAQIHDQLIVKVPSSQASQVAPIVRQLMEGAFKLSIPLVAPAEIGTNFADAH